MRSSFAFNGTFGSGFRPPDPFNPCSHDDLTNVEGEKGLIDSNRHYTAVRVSDHVYLYFEQDEEKHWEASHDGLNMGCVRHISRKHGTKEKQPGSLSWLRWVWEPGRKKAEQSQLDRFVIQVCLVTPARSPFIPKKTISDNIQVWSNVGYSSLSAIKKWLSYEY